MYSYEHALIQLHLVVHHSTAMSGTIIVLLSPNSVMRQVVTSEATLSRHLQQKLLGALVERVLKKPRKVRAKSIFIDQFEPISFCGFLLTWLTLGRSLDLKVAYLLEAKPKLLIDTYNVSPYSQVVGNILLVEPSQ